MKTSGLRLIVVLLAIGCVACGDSSGPTPDTGADTNISEGGTSDTTVDTTVDFTSDGNPTPDQGADMSQSANTVCASPQTVTLASGTATVNGDTTGVANDTTLPLDCGGGQPFTFDAGQRYYTVTLAPGLYSITGNFTGDWSGALFAWPASIGCASAANVQAFVCQGLSAAFGDATTETMWVQVDTQEDYLIMVDGRMTSNEGAFSLTITELTTAPTGSTCAAPATATLTNNTVSIPLDTVGAPNEFGGMIGCGLGVGFPFLGGQIYTQVTLPGNAAIQASLSPAGNQDIAVYAIPAGTNCAATDVETACSNNVADDSFTGGDTETLNFTTGAAPEDWIFVADSYSLQGAGMLTLDITANVFNNQCADPKMITNGSPLTSTSDVADSSSFGTPEFAGVNCGGGTTFAGSVAYFEVALEAGKKYEVVASSDFDAVAYAFKKPTGTCDEAAVNAGCTSPGGDPDNVWNANAEAGAGNEVLFIAPAAAETWVIAVQGVTASDNGSLVVSIDERPITGATCATAGELEIDVTALTAGQSVTVSGTTLATGLTAEFPTLDCANGSGGMLEGVSRNMLIKGMKAALEYEIQLVPLNGSDLGFEIFPSGTACNEAAIMPLCTVRDVSLGTETLTGFAPAADGDFVIIVSGFGTDDSGPYTLRVSASTPPGP